MNAPLIHIEHLHLNAMPAAVIDLGTLAVGTAGNPATATRFSKYANGQLVADDSASWNAVFDNKTGLMWTADTIADDKKWDAAKKAAASVRIGGHDDWRLPELEELESIRDLTKSDPCIDTAFFRCESRYYWSNTPLASSPSDYAWLVLFSFGYANCGARYLQARVRAVRSASPAGECQGATGEVSFRGLYNAWQRARCHKVPSQNQLRFEANWIDGLLDLQQQINAGVWQPRATTCFIATRPKARQIHAPDFADRIVHHWLVPQLDRIYEPGFIHDSYANRRGKGTHAAVARLREHVRQVHSGQGGGWYLQLDIRNFFNSIHRPTLYRMLKQRMRRASLPATVQHIAHALLRQSVECQGVVHRSTAAERSRVPAHKRLENAAPGFGLPIGNLSSQFFANVYLDALDQFVKHTLRAPRYLRYVDDFVLVHESREQLQAWLVQIEAFLRDTLKLELKDDIRLRPLTAGCDFLGYVVYPTHTRVRSRVVKHADAALRGWHRDHQRRDGMHGTPADFRRIGSVWASYRGHFAGADSWQLQQRFHARHPWLASLACTPRRFDHRIEGRRLTIGTER